MQTKEYKYRGKRMFYRSFGQGPVVVLLHGFGEEGSVWKEQYNSFPGLQLLVPDLPGSGQSEAIDDMSMEGLADAVKALIDDEAGIDSTITLIGHSMGGYITLAFADRYPERLRRFGLFHSTAFADTDEKKETRQKSIRFVQEHGAAEFLKTATPNLYAPASREQHTEWISDHLKTVRNFSAASLVSYTTAMIQRPDRTAVLQTSRVPVLFVFGQYDAAVPLQDGWKQCHLPQIAYIHLLEQAGHMGMREETEKANAILTQFVNATENFA